MCWATLILLLLYSVCFDFWPFVKHNSTIILMRFTRINGCKVGLWAWENMRENPRNTCLPIIYYGLFVSFVNWWIFRLNSIAFGAVRCVTFHSKGTINRKWKLRLVFRFCVSLPLGKLSKMNACIIIIIIRAIDL